MGKGLNKFWVQVKDLLGVAITSGLKVSILTADGAIATVYSDSDGTALTNPITSTAFDALSDGVIEWWSATASFDIEIINETGAVSKVEGVSSTDHSAVFDVNRVDSQLVYANTAVSTAHTDLTAATNLDKNVTISGENLKAGDVIEIEALVDVTATNSTDTLTLILKVGTETIISTGAVNVTDDDVGYIRALVTVTTAGASGKVIAQGLQMLGVAGTIIPAPFVKDEASEDISGDVAIVVSATWSVKSASNSCALHSMVVQIHKNGNV